MNKLESEGETVLLHQKTYRSLYIITIGNVFQNCDVAQENPDFLKEVLHFGMLHSPLVVH